MKLDFFTHATYRPSVHPLGRLPVAARSIGHYRKAPGWQDSPVKKAFVQLFWSRSGSGWITHDGVRRVFPAEHVALYFPGDLHLLGNEGDAPWEYYWMTMDGLLVESIVRSFGLERGRLYVAGEPPVAMFERLEAAICNLAAGGELRAGAIAYELLSAAVQAIGMPEGTPPSEDFQTGVMALLHEHWSDPAFGIDALAEAMGMHRSRLTRHFRAAFGMPPSLYLQRWRVQNGLALLKRTTLPIAAIASRCGFSDPNYFARVIQKAIGRAPGVFRQE